MIKSFFQSLIKFEFSTFLQLASRTHFIQKLQKVSFTVDNDNHIIKINTFTIDREATASFL